MGRHGIGCRSRCVGRSSERAQDGMSTAGRCPYESHPPLVALEGTVDSHCNLNQQTALGLSFREPARPRARVRQSGITPLRHRVKEERMRRRNRDLRQISAFLNAVICPEALEQGQREALDRALRKIKRGLKTRNLKLVERGVSDAARLFLRTCD